MKLIFLGFALGLLFASCGSNSEKSITTSVDFDPSPWISKGQEIQKSAFGELSRKLTAAMEKGGVDGALTYCQTHAYPLTDSLSSSFGVSIRRATNQPRNKANKAHQNEATILANYHKALFAGQELLPSAVEEEDGGVSYYGPIRIQPLCLNCHGTPGKELKTKDHDLIKSLYPDDEATGYALGDLRGVWHIQWTKK
jgi:hypothetical protein